MQKLPEALGYSIRAEASSIVGLTDLLLQTAITTEQRDYLLDIKDSTNVILRNISSEQGQMAVEEGLKNLPAKNVALKNLGSSAVRSLMVLVVEDSRVGATIVTKMLLALGHKVDVAENGLVAIAALKDKDYDFVLMDCQMPELDGLAATKIIRSQESGVRKSEIPIIALTARATPHDMRECMAVGMNAYISKPLNIHTLDAIIIRFFSY